jgi:hypothetical protein
MASGSLSRFRGFVTGDEPYGEFGAQRLNQ